MIADFRRAYSSGRIQTSGRSRSRNVWQRSRWRWHIVRARICSCRRRRVEKRGRWRRGWGCACWRRSDARIAALSRVVVVSASRWRVRVVRVWVSQVAACAVVRHCNFYTFLFFPLSISRLSLSLIRSHLVVIYFIYLKYKWLKWPFYYLIRISICWHLL